MSALRAVSAVVGSAGGLGLIVFGFALIMAAMGWVLEHNSPLRGKPFREVMRALFTQPQEYGIAYGGLLIPLVDRIGFLFKWTVVSGVVFAVGALLAAVAT